MRVPYRTVCITHPWGDFPSSVGRQPTRVPISNDTSSESSRGDFPMPTFFGHRHYSDCGDVDHGKSAPGVCYIHPRTYTVLRSYCCIRYILSPRNFSSRCCNLLAIFFSYHEPSACTGRSSAHHLELCLLTPCQLTKQPGIYVGIRFHKHEAATIST